MRRTLLSELVGESLSSVVFVLDYLQLDFNGSRFTSWVWPDVRIGAESLAFGDRGYRDALCAFIDHEVMSADETQAAGLVIRFGLGSISTNPRAHEVPGPEIAMLTIYDSMYQTEAWDIWRPGEGIFTGPDWS
jgi:hypothetical protein